MEEFVFIVPRPFHVVEYPHILSLHRSSISFEHVYYLMKYTHLFS